MSKLKCGLIQMGLKGDASMSPAQIRDKMLDAHVPLIEKAAHAGVKAAGSISPWKPNTDKLECVIEFNRQEQADFACRMPGAKKYGAYEVVFQAKDLKDLHRGARMLMALAGLGEGN